MIVCMASGNGSNFEAIVKSGIKIELVITNRPTARVIERAKKYNIPCIFNSTEYEACVPKNTKLVVLAGFMRILSNSFTETLSGKIINIHPSLLPKFKGLNTFERALENKEKKTGCTVHYVNSKLDDGRIILKKKFYINFKDNVETLKHKTQKLEYKAYPEAIIKVFRDF